MPNTFKYNTSSIESQSLRKSNFYIGTGDVGKGTSALTGFYNGFPLGTFSYVIVLHRGGNIPTYYRCQDDAELISRTNQIDTSSVRTTKEQCFSYFASQSDKMVVNKDYDPIITDGLVLNLDMSYLSSFPATGSAWSDLSSNQNNGTLVNSPVFSSSGWIQFDGQDEQVNIPNSASVQVTGDQTLEFIVYPERHDRRQNWYDKAYGGEGTITYEVGGNMNYFWGTAGSNNQPYQGVGTSGSPLSTLNRWYHVVLVRELSTATKTVKWYINGSLNVTVSASYAAAVASTTQIRLGTGYTNFFLGRMSITRQYNIALSQSQVLQNYYQGPIVTDGLVFSFDSSNIISYPFTGTTAYSLTGSNTLTLANGVGFDKKYGGRWTFDGSNDRLDSNFTDIIDSVTIECWYRGTKTTRNHLWNFGVYPTTNFHCNFNDSGIPLWFYWNGNGTPRLWFTQGNFTDGTIKQLVFTHQGSDNQAYLNGQLLTAGRATSGTQTFNNVNSGGTFNLGGDPSFGGDIYQVRIYNRALSASEISQNFNAHRSRFDI